MGRFEKHEFSMQICYLRLGRFNTFYAQLGFNMIQKATLSSF